MKCRSFKKDEAMCISGTILWRRDLFNGMKHKSLRISVRERFSALPQRLDLISVGTDGGVFWLSVCDTVSLGIHRQNNWKCWLAIQSLQWRLLCCSLCIFSSSDPELCSSLGDTVDNVFLLASLVNDLFMKSPKSRPGWLGDDILTAWSTLKASSLQLHVQCWYLLCVCVCFAVSPCSPATG